MALIAAVVVLVLTLRYILLLVIGGQQGSVAFEWGIVTMLLFAVPCPLWLKVVTPNLQIFFNHTTNTRNMVWQEST